MSTAEDARLNGSVLALKAAFAAAKLEGKVVICRQHGWKYDVTTGNMPLAPGMSLGCYPVKVVDGKIQVAVS